VGPGSRRSVPLPAGWEKTRLRILKRDGYACQWPVPGGVCGAPANQVDHIHPAHLGGGDEDENLRSLCDPHHLHVSGVQAGRASAALRRELAARRTRPQPRHPGLTG
jgi:5-methylcytosine-specific restriction protein A